ncbi:ABC transporter permease [Candidatus Gottesmanbacteria bacterium]|nr:ABC transporter permease [Candidatus Gottesmanbacteria bacterium]
MFYLKFIIKSAIDDFRRNKVRSILTSLGILIGVASVILLIAFGLGLKKYISDQFETLGKNLVMVLPGQGFGRMGGQGLIGGIEFDEKDVSKIKRIKGVEALAGFFIKTIKIESKTNSQISTLLATSADGFAVTNLKIDKGNFFTNADNEKGAKIVVLGGEIATKLFESADEALGAPVTIQGQRYTVIGILKKAGGGALGSEIDTRSIVPFKSAYTFNPNKKFFAMYIKAQDEANIDDLRKEIKNTLLKRYNEDDFSVTESSELMSTINSIFSILNAVLVAIAAISLIVGGIGIMNIMYVTVTERIKEIGIRRAVGATKSDILYQFLSESVILSLLGGFLGLFISFLVVAFIQRLFPAYIDLQSVLIALGVSSFIGIVFGVFPAKRAADLTPVEAIRYE